MKLFAGRDLCAGKATHTFIPLQRWPAWSHIWDPAQVELLTCLLFVVAGHSQAKQTIEQANKMLTLGSGSLSLPPTWALGPQTK